MSKQGGGFFNYLIIIFFAGCIVALAAAELHQRYRGGRPGRTVSSGSAGQLVRDLHGQASSPGARIRRATPAEERVRNSRGEPSAPVGGRDKQQAVSPEESRSQSDKLGWSDRRQLNDLINNLSP